MTIVYKHRSAQGKTLTLIHRKEFADCTVLTIAHRLNTIMDSDRVTTKPKILFMLINRTKVFECTFNIFVFEINIGSFLNFPPTGACTRCWQGERVWLACWLACWQVFPIFLFSYFHLYLFIFQFAGNLVDVYFIWYSNLSSCLPLLQALNLLWHGQECRNRRMIHHCWQIQKKSIFCLLSSFCGVQPWMLIHTKFDRPRISNT